MNYRHGFLVATLNHQKDSPLERSVVYVCENAAGGSLGLVLNKVLDVRLSDLTQKRSPNLRDTPVYFGGETQTHERGFVLHRPLGQFWEGTTELASDLHMTTTKDLLEELERFPESHYKVFLGYVGWPAYHLEYEIAQDLWVSLPYQSDFLWSSHRDLWERCYAEIGIHPQDMGCVDRGVVLPH